jgi:type VI secretion system protein ImpM
MAGFGAFGKIPNLGDFVRSGVAPDFLDPWDRWVQATMLRARTDLGPRWQACYLSAPIWRFTLTAGLCGAAGAQGVLMPSVDRVGRQFPLTLVTALPAGRSAILAHLTATATFEALETLALDALGDGVNRDALVARAAAIRPASLPGTPVVMDTPAMVALSGGPDADPAHLVAYAAAARFRVVSVWSADLSPGPRVAFCDGLPDNDGATALFDIDDPRWQGGGAPARPSGRPA